MDILRIFFPRKWCEIQRAKFDATIADYERRDAEREDFERRLNPIWERIRPASYHNNFPEFMMLTTIYIDRETYNELVALLAEQGYCGGSFSLYGKEIRMTEE